MRKKQKRKWETTILAWPFMIIYYAIADIIRSLKRGTLDLYGVCLYVGEVGSGKTLGMVERAERLKRRDPKINVWSNFPLSISDHVFSDLRELEDLPSYTIVLLSEGALLANSRDWQSFPAGTVELLTQNRKWGVGEGRPPGVLLMWDVQDPLMIDAQVRRLTNSVAECHAHLNFGNGPRLMTQRWVRPREYFAASNTDRPMKRMGVFAYVATDRLRSLYATHFKVEKKSK